MTAAKERRLIIDEFDDDDKAYFEEGWFLTFLDPDDQMLLKLEHGHPEETHKRRCCAALRGALMELLQTYNEEEIRTLMDSALNSAKTRLAEERLENDLTLSVHEAYNIKTNPIILFPIARRND
jgi:hypothetical protein